MFESVIQSLMMSRFGGFVKFTAARKGWLIVKGEGGREDATNIYCWTWFLCFFCAVNNFTTNANRLPAYCSLFLGRNCDWSHWKMRSCWRTRVMTCCKTRGDVRRTCHRRFWRRTQRTRGRRRICGRSEWSCTRCWLEGEFFVLRRCFVVFCKWS